MSDEFEFESLKPLWYKFKNLKNDFPSIKEDGYHTKPLFEQTHANVERK